MSALGGEKTAEPGETIVNPGVTGAQDNPAFAEDNNNDGDPEAAAALLEEAGVETPYPIKLGYQSSPTMDNAMGVVKESWDAAGFDVSLEPLADTYYDVIARPDDDYDVTWAGWGADWPSMSTVLPPLFDSRPNFSSTTCGQDYGCYQSDEFEALVDEAGAASSADEQVAKLAGGGRGPGSGLRLHPAGDHELPLAPWFQGHRVHHDACVEQLPGDRSDRRRQLTLG